ncbi:MAG: 2Fe-2S iron-sulfur cluster binding domain-containing protein [bacterium]|nr:2Fe-2S iron-sulfur cluster binding domain-containing protein [bacterium]
MIEVTINGDKKEFPEGETLLLECLKESGIRVPTLCYHKELTSYGSCRLCLVEVATERNPDMFKLIPACCTPIMSGQIINTETEKVKESRKFLIELFLARSPESETLQELARDFGVPSDTDALDNVGKYLLTRTKPLFDTECVLCGLCVRVCAEVPERHALSFTIRGIKRNVAPPFHRFADTCIGCQSCVYVCPTNTITVEEVT